MSKFKKCPSCGNKASGGLLGGVYVSLHKCKRKGHYFCNRCKNGDRCPLCQTDRIYWDVERAHTDAT